MRIVPRVTLVSVAVSLAILSGCTDATVYDPYLAAAGAQATLAAATAQARGTYEAAYAAGATGTMQAARTRQASEAEQDRLAAEIEATRQAVAAVQTVGAATAQAATVQAEVVRSTTAAMVTETESAKEAAYWQATETAMAISVAREQQDVQFRKFVYTFAGFSMVALAIIAGIAIHRLVDWYIVWQDRKHMWFENTRGLVLFHYDEDGNLIPVIPGQVTVRGRVVSRGEDPDDVIPLTHSGSVLASPMAPKPRGLNTVHRQAIDLVDAAIAWHGDGEANTIPGWRQLEGWSSSTWQRAVAAMEARGLVEAAPGQGTYITEQGGHTLSGLRYLLVSNQVRLRPTPAGGGHGS